MWLLGVGEKVGLKICDKKKKNFSFEFMSNGDFVSGFFLKNLYLKMQNTFNLIFKDVECFLFACFSY